MEANQQQPQPSITTRFLLHEQGRALWAEHKPLEQILALQATTPPGIFEATYQGNPTAPEGTTYKRGWWSGKNRYDITDVVWRNLAVGRYQSWDTAQKDKDTAAYTAMIEFELQPDYRANLRRVYRERLEFPDLPEAILAQARRGNSDNKLRAIIVEDKSSGISALQTLRKSTTDQWVNSLLVAFNPPADKQVRAEQAAVWCRNDCILLPYPNAAAPWLLDFEDELFEFPGSAYKDQVDAFSQLVLWMENLLAAGWQARNGA